MNQTDSVIHKLKLISKVKSLIFNQTNMKQTLHDVFSQGNKALLDKISNDPTKTEGTQTDFETQLSENCTQTSDKELSTDESKKSNSLYSSPIKKEIDPQIEEKTFHPPLSKTSENNPSPPRQPDIVSIESISSKIHPDSNDKPGLVDVQEELNKSIPVDVLILIKNQDVISYVERSFEHLNVRFLYNINDMKFENPTIIVRISASRNLDDSLELAIRKNQPKKSVTMVLLSQGSTPINDKQIHVSRTNTRINTFTFLYNDKYNVPPFRKQEACNGIYKISDVLNLIRQEC